MSKAVVFNQPRIVTVEAVMPAQVTVEAVTPAEIVVTSQGTQGPAWIIGDLQEWEEGKDFLRAHAVYHRGGTFRCIAAHTATTATEPDQGATWALVWEQVSRPGQGAAALPLEIEDPQDGDVLRFRSGAWTNETPEQLVDGGNF